jgi:hypothetical protein
VSRRRGLPSPAVALLALCLLLAGCRGERDQTLRLPGGTPIVLVSVDTLRSDRLPMYGYGGVVSPAHDALRRDSIQ